MRYRQFEITLKFNVLIYKFLVEYLYKLQKNQHIRLDHFNPNIINHRNFYIHDIFTKKYIPIS